MVMSMPVVDRRVQPDRRGSGRGPDRRKPGRKSLVEGETTRPVCVRLNASLHDAICLLALRDDDDLGAVIRQALQHYVSANPVKR